MIRMTGLLTSLILLAACGGDRREVQQSSMRAAYIPVTPGAVAIPSGDGAAMVTAAAMTTVPRGVTPPAPVARFATGPIYSACRSAGRSGASRERCGCVQWVADRYLNAAQQSRGADFFTNQHDLQEVRQSDNRSNEAFWTAWRAFGAMAGDACRGT